MRSELVPVAGIGECVECAASRRNRRMRSRRRRKDWRMRSVAQELENAERRRNWKMHRMRSDVVSAVGIRECVKRVASRRNWRMHGDIVGTREWSSLIG